MNRRVRRVNCLAAFAAAALAAAVLSPGVAVGSTPDHQPAATGGGTSAVLTLHEGSSLGLAVSPGHDKLAMNFLGNLWTLPAVGGKATRVSSLLQDTAYPDWSPDGKTIAFQSYKSGTFHVWAMRPDGTKVRQLTSGFYDDREPQFSPDGSRIAFSSDRPPLGSAPGVMSGVYNVWVLHLATGRLSQITHAAAAQSDYYPTWSPNGRRIAFVNTSHEIDAIAADGRGRAQKLYADPAGTFYSPTWAPGGRHLAYIESLTTPTQATRLMVDGAARSGNEDVFPMPARWISATTLIYGGNGHVLQRDLVANTVKTVPFSARVSFNRARYQKKTYDFNSTKPHATKGIVAPALAPDGRHVAFVALNQVWEMRIGHKPIRLTHDVYYKADPTWSPDGKYLAYATDKDGPMAIYIRTMRNGRTRKLTEPARSTTLSQAEMAWSPDGRKIAFQSAVDNDTNADTYVANVATGKVREVLGTQFEPGRPTWAPDSTTLALAAWKPYSSRFREGESLILTVNVNTGATRWNDPYPYQTITNRVGGDGPAWSPDGKYMAYVLDDVLWLLPVTPSGAPAGPARQVTKEVADQVSWSGNSHHILYNSNGTLRTLAVSAGHAAGRPTTVAVPLSWTPSKTTGWKVIHAGALWAGTSGSLQRNVDIVVHGNRIDRVVPARPRAWYGAGVRYVDASKLTVIPGLWDAHRHEQLDQPYAGGRSNRLEMSLGITSVMSMGDAAYPALEEAESQQSGARVGPRYFWAAEPVDGRRIYYNFMRATPDRKALSRELSRISALQPDVLKTYVRLPNSMEATAIRAGHAQGIPSFSHYFWPALAFGQDGTSHWATQRDGFQVAVSNDTVAYNDTIALYARSGMSITNTPFSGVQFMPGLASDARLKTLLSPWQYSNAVEQYAAGPESAASLAFQRGWGQADAKIIKAGGTVLIGTDASLGLGDFGQIVAISVAAHTGLSNYESLRASTVEPAKVMGVSNELGTIKPGMLADLDMVRGNPLAHINAIKNVKYVMQNGRLYTQQQLRKPYANVHLNSPRVRLSAALNGSKEVGGGDHQATGTAIVTVNRAAGRVCATVHSNVSHPTAMHLHKGAAGVNGPIVVPLDARTINHGTDCVPVTEAQAAALIAHPAGYYLNIHTGAFPDGALRGQLRTARKAKKGS